MMHPHAGMSLRQPHLSTVEDLPHAGTCHAGLRQMRMICCVALYLYFFFVVYSKMHVSGCGTADCSCDPL